MNNQMLIGLLLACLLLLLAGCASCPDPIQTSPLPMSHLYEPTPPPFCADRTNEDLLECLGRMREALDACNADKAALTP